MRASVLLQGALLTRFSEANLPLPAGDAVGLRSLDFHLSGLRAMGASVTRDAGLIRASAPRGLKGAEILLPQPSVGTTENLLLAAVLGGRNCVLWASLILCTISQRLRRAAMSHFVRYLLWVRGSERAPTARLGSPRARIKGSRSGPTPPLSEGNLHVWHNSLPLIRWERRRSRQVLCFSVPRQPC